MNLEEAKALFAKHHKEESDIINNGPKAHGYFAASLVWTGFKSALILTGALRPDGQKKKQ